MALTQTQINEFTRRAKLAGLDDTQIQGEIAKKVAEFNQTNGLTQPPTPNKPNVGSTGGSSVQSGNFASTFVPSLNESFEGFAGNVGKSLVKNIGDIFSAAINVLNPNLDENTVGNIGKLGIDAVKLAAGDKDEANRAKLVVDYYKKRYGEDLGDTLYQDPVGVLLDISTVMGGTSALLKGAGAVSKSTTLAKTAGMLEKASVAIDPIAKTGKLATNALKYTKVADKVAETTKGVRESIAEEAARRSLRANPTQMEKFQELIGTADEPGDIGKWMTGEGIYTKDDVVLQRKSAQKEYNSLVRTDKPISGQVFAEKLKARADEIEKSDVSPSAVALAAKLREEAKRVGKIKNITDTILTNSKTSQFSKVGKKAMTDPITDNFNKEYGSIALQTLDEIAPGSAKVGKKLQILREFDGIVSKQRNLGKGAQLINIFKPAFTGMTGGYILSGGNVASSLGFGVAASLTTNPYILKSSAKMLTEGIKLSEKTAEGIKVAGKVADTVTKTGRLNSEAEKLQTETSQEGKLPGKDNSLLGTNPTESQGSSPNGELSYTGSLPQARKEAVTGLVAMGVTDPQAQLELLNYDEDGNKVGDFTISEVVGYQSTAEKVNRDSQTIAPTIMNPFGGLSKRQVLALALSKGASKKDLDEVGSLYDTFATDTGTISQENMKIVDGLSSEYYQRTKDSGFIDIQNNYKKIANTGDSAAGDLSMIYGYMKLLDPSSVVRETEADMAQNAGSFGDRVQNAMNRIVNGKRLTEEQRRGFIAEAKTIFNQYATRQTTLDAFYQGKARQYGVDPSLVGIGIYK